MIYMPEKEAITKTEFYDDRVVVHYHLQKPFGVPDEDGKIEVLYKSIPKLEVRPNRIGLGDNWIEEVYIPTVDKTILFIIDSFQETASRKEWNIYGPYLEK